jgi:hypothetical protein
MAKTNIWDKLKFDKKSPNLLKELNSQAQHLADKTEGILYGEVNPVDAYDESTFELGIFYNFYVYAPYLGNIRTLLFTVVEVGKKIILVDRINNSGKLEATSADDLIAKIEDIISNDEAATLLTNLYSSSIEFKSK